jgi:hypothetical protein
MQDRRRYYPDFYLSKLNLYIEIKPLFRFGDYERYKFQQTRLQGHRIWLMTEKNWHRILKLILNMEGQRLCLITK